ncbi:ATP-binding protein, partial [Peptoniphilus sp.]|uniref:ATP-binding protein n=1 Tax=Peptoniphilus sp. TaxID=1971214 RepID=UPI003D8F68B4
MKFKEFGLLNFGKFNNETINFYDGINIIYGENEFGKSTIVNFIDGVFYGFSRDSLKRKVRDELFDKCRPWNSSSYNGYIEIIDKDETYRIFRDFETDEVSILNKSTGLDLSNLSVLNKYSRIEQPGAYFFDINRKVFKSTVFIGQNMSVFQDDAAEDLKKRVNNFATALDENINVNKVLDKMNKDIDSYGNERRKSSLIGSVTDELEKIERQKSSLILDKVNYDINIKKLKDTKDELKALEKKYRGRKSYDIENLKSEIKELEKNLSEYAKKHDMDDFERAIEINNDIHSKSNRLDEILSLDQCEIIEEDKDISEDLENYKKAKAKIAELNINNYSKEMEFISVDIRNTRRKMNFYLIKIILGILIGFAVIGTAFYYNRPIFSLISAIFFTYSYFRIVKYNINKDLYNRLDVKLRDLKKLSIEKTGIKKEYDKYFDGLLKKYSVNSLNELDKVLKNFESENLKKK